MKNNPRVIICIILRYYIVSNINNIGTPFNQIINKVIQNRLIIVVSDASLKDAKMDGFYIL